MAEVKISELQRQLSQLNDKQRSFEELTMHEVQEWLEHTAALQVEVAAREKAEARIDSLINEFKAYRDEAEAEMAWWQDKVAFKIDELDGSLPRLQRNRGAEQCLEALTAAIQASASVGDTERTMQSAHQELQAMRNGMDDMRLHRAEMVAGLERLVHERDQLIEQVRLIVRPSGQANRSAVGSG